MRVTNNNKQQDELLAVSLEDLKLKQRLRMLKVFEDTVIKLRDHLASEEYAHARMMLGDSPSGDGYGKDNSYISFAFTGVVEDIGDVIDYLEERSEKKKANA